MSKRSSLQTLISFVPRQVMLETAIKSSAIVAEDNHKKNNKKKRRDHVMEKNSKKRKSSLISISVEDSAGSPKTLVLDRPIGHGVLRKKESHGDLLRSIAAFLEGNLLAKTLSVFRSEAQIEVNNEGGSCINLEDLFEEHFESRKHNPVADIELPTEEGDLNAKSKDKMSKSRQIFNSLSREKSCLDATIGTDENTACIRSANIKEVVKDTLKESKDLAKNLSTEEDDAEKEKKEKKEKKGSKKVCKQLDSTDNITVIVDNGDKKEKRKSKKNKSENPIDGTHTAFQKGAILASNGSSDVELRSKKKRKTSCKENEDQNALISPEILPSDLNFGKTSKVLSNGVSENHTLHDSSMKLGEYPTKKEKHSREPKTLNAFQRVKIDDIEFADERLQDNSYWALDDSGSGYGAKAQNVLGQVKGRDFRHEKTKKKRGTYRGGQIDLQSHSVKFNYSDDD